ncbi:hypothetical protein PGT21_011482 [Puccinia graminis f. sp. tritici]|uniref:Uncharacterized protein n=1 Tax=Puccinia graminis f. sp. tritici TaxID=56615 RepID=A0A5B0PKQ3_PUCGR|nr:hypothetical protein PGT21_011482 [Puccinia graminis f. sp. tritici]
MSLADIATTVKRDLVVPRPSWSGTLACADEHAANYGCCFRMRSIGHTPCSRYAQCCEITNQDEDD